MDPQIYAASHNTTRTSRFVACSYIFKKSYASHPSRFMCLEYNPRSRYIDMHINSWFANVKYNRWYTPLLASISTRRSLGTLCPLWLSSWATIPNGIEPVTSSEMSNSHWTAWSGWECGRGNLSLESCWWTAPFFLMCDLCFVACVPDRTCLGLSARCNLGENPQRISTNTYKCLCLIQMQYCDICLMK